MTETIHAKLLPFLENPLTVEVEGKRHIIVGITDYDGTAVDEMLPEHERLGTIGPARETTAILERNRILVGVGTSRSSGEALAAQDAIAGHGITFAEDGATVILPKEDYTETTTEKIKRVFGDMLTVLDGRYIVRLSNLSLDRLDEFIQTCAAEARSRDPKGSAGMVSTRFSSPDRLQEIAKHSSVAAARMSAERLASAYIAEPSQTQREVIERLAPEWGIRAHGHHINLIGEDANKGRAIRFINAHASYFIPQYNDVAGIIPIFFGNGKNDIPLFKEAEAMGGFGVIVGHPKGGYALDENNIPPNVIKQPEPYGHGMKASLPGLFDKINQRYGTKLKV